MNENKLISTIISSREAYSKLSSHIDYSTFSDLGREIYKEITHYYSVDPVINNVDLDIVKTRLDKRYGKKFDLFNEYIEALPEPTSIANLLDLFLDHQKERLGLDISQALATGNDKKVKELMDKYLTLGVIEKEEEEVLNNTPLEDLEVHFTGQNLIPIYPSKLNNLLGGGVPRESQICIVARPDVGKSTTAINIAGGAAKNGYKVLYINNEESKYKMMYRLVSRLLGKKEQDIKQDLKGNYEAAQAIGYKNIWLVPMYPGTLEEIRAWIEKVRPDVVIVDQIRNLALHESKVINLENGCIGMRNLAKEFEFVSILVTQAGDSAHNKLVLEYNDVEWSNTGVAGALDLMIGVGRNEQFRDEGKVMLSFDKNKLTAPIKPFHCKIDYETQRLLV